MSAPQQPLIPLSVMDFDLSKADDVERCRAQLLVYNYLRVAPSMTTDMQRVLKEVLVYDRAWKTPTENIPNDGTVSIYDMYQELRSWMYFPYWFVVAVCWGPNHPDLQQIRENMSRHWGKELPKDVVIFPGEKTLLDFDTFCGEIDLMDKLEDCSFKSATTEAMAELPVASSTYKPTIQQSEPPDQSFVAMEVDIEALQKAMRDLEARVGMIEEEGEWGVDIVTHLSDHFQHLYQNQQDMAAEIAELKAWVKEKGQ
ncbi:hypothetical protein G7Z17_g4857 [Cylindrodendrum hubeiense]|uniref:Uncharacterized protein n=1 Tax=Cylindrodendrum hubeiense TaxID=595255 RepID=A0A9P5HFB0_9HYPO|nr:hypothetical protein G7Z17_g4857 [Cylindrodendrum hubeiense]